MVKWRQKSAYAHRSTLTHTHTHTETHADVPPLVCNKLTLLYALIHTQGETKRKRRRDSREPLQGSESIILIEFPGPVWVWLVDGRGHSSALADHKSASTVQQGTCRSDVPERLRQSEVTLGDQETWLKRNFESWNPCVLMPSALLRPSQSSQESRREKKQEVSPAVSLRPLQ